jgi:hypothetical protein
MPVSVSRRFLAKRFPQRPIQVGIKLDPWGVASRAILTLEFGRSWAMVATPFQESAHRAKISRKNTQ